MYKAVLSRIELDDPLSLSNFEDQMTALLDEGYLPWGVPGIAMNGSASVIVQHMIKQNDESQIDGPDDMG